MSREEGYNISETGNWNVADSYAKLKIMKPLYLADDYANIAIFGTANLLDELQNPNLPVDYLKIKGFERLVQTLILLIDNTVFAVKVKKADLEKNREELEKIFTIIPGLTKNITKDRGSSKEMKIIGEKYNPLLARVLKIKRDINEPLNQAHLIFVDKEEFDPKAYKEMIKKRMIEEG